MVGDRNWKWSESDNPVNILARSLAPCRREQRKRKKKKKELRQMADSPRV